MADISFPSFPSNWRLPLFWAEVDPSQAGGGQPNLPALLVGQMLTTGTAAAGAPIAVGTLADAQNYFGIGSMLERMVARFFAINPTASGDGLFCLPIADPSAGVASTCGVAVTQPATADGVFTLYIAGQKVQITVDSTDTVATIASNLVAAINALTTLPVTAVQGGGTKASGSIGFPANPSNNDTITLGGTVVTFKTNGAAGNQVNIAGNLAGTMANLLAFLQSSTDANIAQATYATSGTSPELLNITAATGGPAGNSFTIAASAATPSGATLAGGTAFTGAVNLTCRWLGATGNDIVIVANYGGTLSGEVMPAGMAIAITAMSGGAGTPSFSTPIANLSDDVYYFTGMPYTDAASLTAWDTEYGFTQAGRWGWLRQLYGNVYSAIRGTYSGLVSWGPTGNSAVESVMGVETSSPSPVWEWTAAYTAQAMAGFLEDPARPLQTLELTGILPALKPDRFTKGEANTLAGYGIAVQQVGPNGYPVIMIEVTRYQVNQYGQSSQAFYVVTTLTTLAELFRRMKQAITSKYPRSKLAADGTNFATGQAIVTPKIAKAELISEYRAAEYVGLVQDTNTFKSNLVVEIDSENGNRLNVLYPPNLIGQLRIFAVLGQFRLGAQNSTPTSIAA
jgi:phage tail sheath gpL-like